MKPQKLTLRQRNYHKKIVRGDCVKTFHEIDPTSKVTIELRGGAKARTYKMGSVSNIITRNATEGDIVPPHGSDDKVSHIDFPFSIQVYFYCESPALRKHFPHFIRLCGPNPGKPTDDDIIHHFGHWWVIIVRYIGDEKDFLIYQMQAFHFSHLLKVGIGQDKAIYPTGENKRENTVRLYPGMVHKHIISLDPMKERGRPLFDTSTAKDLNNFWDMIFKEEKERRKSWTYQKQINSKMKQTKP